MSWKERLHEIIFETDSRAGKLFDVLLIGSILLSVIVVTLDSIQSYRLAHGDLFPKLEWFFTILFTIGIFLASPQ